MSFIIEFSCRVFFTLILFFSPLASTPSTTLQRPSAVCIVCFLLYTTPEFCIPHHFIENTQYLPFWIWVPFLDHDYTQLHPLSWEWYRFILLFSVDGHLGIKLHNLTIVNSATINMDCRCVCCLSKQIVSNKRDQGSLETQLVLELQQKKTPHFCIFHWSRLCRPTPLQRIQLSIVLLNWP